MTRTRDVAEILKRKVKDHDGEEVSNSSCLFQLKRRRSQNSTTSSAEPGNSDDPCPNSCFSHQPLASCSSSNVSSGNSKEKLKTKDLQEVSSGGVEMAITTTFNTEETERNGSTTSSSNLQVGVAELESTTAPPSAATSRNKSTQAKMPSEDELEEFFSSAKRDIQKQFSKKYNFDFEKEEPLEGRFEWVQVKP